MGETLYWLLYPPVSSLVNLWRTPGTGKLNPGRLMREGVHQKDGNGKSNVLRVETGSGDSEVKTAKNDGTIC